jgi:hypothetical protein
MLLHLTTRQPSLADAAQLAGSRRRGEFEARGSLTFNYFDQMIARRWPAMAWLWGGRSCRICRRMAALSAVPATG